MSTISAKSFPRPSDERMNLRDGWAADKSAATILDAMGHPGYGEKFSRRVLAAMAADPDLTAHEAVYGRRTATV